MKTNQVMIRPMGCFSVEQRTKDAFFNATALLKQWNSVSKVERKMDNYFASDKTKAFINTIMERENLNTPKLVYLKNRGKYNGGTWMHPMLFIDFAMWIDPEFKYDVLKFVYDQMIEYRNEAGDAYRELAKAVSKIVSKEFLPIAMSRIAKGINYCIFGEHGQLIRNQHGNEKKMRELFQFERKVADLINEDFITDYNSAIAYLRKMWSKSQAPKVLADTQA